MSTYSTCRGAILAAVCAALVLSNPHRGLAEPATVLLSGSVVDSDGKAVAKAELFFRPAAYWVGVDKWASPPTQTDAAGHFQIALPKTAENGKPVFPGTLWAFKPGRRLAWQSVSAAPETPPLKLALGPPSQFRIKVLAPNKKPLAGAQVTVSQFGKGDGKDQQYPPQAIQTRMTALSDSKGIATLAAVVPEGTLGIHITSAAFGGQLLFVQNTPANDLTLNLAAVGRVRGRVVADKPEAARNIHLQLFTQLRHAGEVGLAYAEAVSDDQGRFEVSLAEGELNVRVVELKPSYLLPADRREVQVLKAGEIADVEVRIMPAVRVHGVVRERGTGKRVPAIGISYPRSAGTIEWAEPDASGHFEFYTTAGGIDYQVRCSQPDKIATWLCSHFAAVPANVKEFELPPIELRYAHIRVVDDAGKPVPGATVKNVWYKPTIAEQPASQGLTGTTGSAKPVSTGADGRFAVWVEAGTKYCLSVRAEGMSPLETEWTDFGKTAAIPDIVLHRPLLRAIAGRVVDRQGRPVAGVTVFQSRSGPKPTEAVTAADGKFSLAGIADPKAFLFARKAGFRFCGRMVEGSAGEVELVLARAGEPSARILHALPLVLGRAERLAMAKRVLEPVTKEAMAAEDTSGSVGLLLVLARVEPARALQLIERKPAKDPYVQDMIRGAAAVALFGESPDEARAVLETLSDPFCRCMIYVSYFWDVVPASERSRRVELAAEALLHLQGITEPWQRVIMRGQIAKRLIELGQKDKAAKLLRDGQTAAKTLAVVDMEGYARATLADELAAIDLPAALELIKDLRDDEEYCRHHGNIAHKIAGVNPAEAQRVLGLLRARLEKKADLVAGAIDQYAPRVCYRMASVDLKRAKEIAAAVTDVYQKAQAHAVMAQALAKTQPAAARELLDRAFAVLEESRDSKGSSDMGHDASSVAASLLPIAELIDPQLVDEFLWRAISLRRRLDGSEEPVRPDRPRGDQPDVPDVRLALMLARYDRATAAALFAPHGTRLPTDTSHRDETAAVLSAAAILDPKRAAAMVEGLPDGEAKRDARQRLAKMLTYDENKCWNVIQGRILGMWVVDEEDLGDTD
jgi:hypothetical protein